MLSWIIFSILSSFCFSVSLFIDLKVWPNVWKLLKSHVNNLWVSASALTCHFNIPWFKTFLWVATILTLWPWSWSLTYLLKIISLQIKIKQWIVDLWYFKWVYLSVESKCFNHVTLEAYVLKTFNFFNNIWIWVLELWYFTWLFLVISSVDTFWPWHLTNF